MSHFYMFVPTKAHVKLANENTGHAQGIGIILYHFPNWPIIYPVVPVNYCTVHRYNTISLVPLKCYVSFHKFASEPLGNCDYVDSQARSWISPYQTRKNLDYSQIEIFNVNPQRNKNIMVPTMYVLSKQNISQIINQIFGHVLITRLRRMARKIITKGLSTNTP